MKRLRLVAIGLLITGPALAESDITKIGAINKVHVDATLTDKYCPELLVDKIALDNQMIRIGGDLLVTGALGDFMRLDQTKAWIQMRTEAFKRFTALECEKSRLFVHLKGIVKQKHPR